MFHIVRLYYHQADCAADLLTKQPFYFFSSHNYLLCLFLILVELYLSLSCSLFSLNIKTSIINMFFAICTTCHCKVALPSSRSGSNGTKGKRGEKKPIDPKRPDKKDNKGKGKKEPARINDTKKKGTTKNDRAKKGTK